MLVGDGGDGGVLEEAGRVTRLVPVQLDEGLRAKGAVGDHGDVLARRELGQGRLDEVWVVFDLEGGGADLGVA